MKKQHFEHYASTFFLWLAATSAASAQHTGRALPEERAGKQTERMNQELTLTDEQYKKVGEINLKYAQKNEAVANADEGRMKKMSAIRTNRDQKNAEMKKVLTEAQYNKYLEIQEEMAAKMRQQRMR